MGDAEELGARRARVRQADHGLRPPRLPRRGPALADPQADGAGARRAAGRGRRGARAGRAEGPAGAASRARARHERRVLLGDRARRRRDPAAARAGDVRLLAGRRLVGAHPRAEADRPAVPALRALRRSRLALASEVDGTRSGLEPRRGRGRGKRARGERERARPREAPRRLGRRARGGGPVGGLSASGRPPTARSASSASGRRRSCCGAASRTRARRAAARRSSRSSCSRASIRARSTRSGRCCTASRTPTTTRPSAGSRSSRCGTARRSATRSSCSRGSPRRTGCRRRPGRPRPRSPRGWTSARRLASCSRRRGRGARGRTTGRSGGGASIRARSSAGPPRTSEPDPGDRAGEHHQVWIGGHP